MGAEVISGPAPVEIVPDGWGIAARILLAVLGVLHAVTCVVFLYVVYRMFSALSAMQERLSELSNTFGG